MVSLVVSGGTEHIRIGSLNFAIELMVLGDVVGGGVVAVAAREMKVDSVTVVVAIECR